MRRVDIILGAAILLILGLYILVPGGGDWLLLAASLVWLIIFLKRRSFSSFGLVIVLGILLRIAFIPAMPPAGAGIYRYISDQMTTAMGFDPYLMSPDISGPPDGDDEMINAADLASAYPPGAETLFLFLASVGLGGIEAWKLFVTAIDIAAVLILAEGLRSEERGAGDLALYAWSPILIAAAAGGGSLPALATSLGAIAIGLSLLGRHLLSGFVWGISGAAGYITLPSAAGWAAGEKPSRRLGILAIIAATAVAISWPFLFGTDFPGPFPEEIARRAADAPPFWSLGLFIPGIVPLLLVPLIASSMGVIYLWLRPRMPEENSLILGILLVLTAPASSPTWTIFLLPLLSLVPSPGAALIIASGPLLLINPKGAIIPVVLLAALLFIRCGVRAESTPGSGA